MKAQDIMVTNVICVDMDERLPNVRKIMVNNGFHHLPVTEKGKLVGIISDRDLLRFISPFIKEQVIGIISWRDLVNHATFKT